MVWPKGKKHGIDVRDRISKALRGRKKSLQHRQKISNALEGDKNPMWKGGRRQHGEDSFIRILRPDHPSAHKDGYVLEHRPIMENHLGRFLTPEEVVHHINGDPADNGIENLILFKNQAEHIAFHHRSVGIGV